MILFVFQLSGLELRVIRSHHRFFYSTCSSGRKLRFSIQNNHCYHDSGREILKFCDLFWILWTAHLTSTGSCQPKGAETLAVEVRQKVFLTRCREVIQKLKDICGGCKISAVSKPAVPNVPKVIPVSGLFDRVQIDLIDMAPDSQRGMSLNISGFRYIMTVVECFSRYCLELTSKRP